MALTFGTDLTVTGNIKLTEVQLVQGAWRTLSGSAATGSVPIQRIEDGQLYYLESENKVVKATVTFNSETFQNEATFADFAWPSATSASYAVTASYAENAGGGGGGGGITISNNVNNRVLTGDGSNANAEAKLTFDGTILTLGSATKLQAESGSFSGPVSSSSFILSEIQGATPPAKTGGMIFSGSAFYLGFE